MNKPLLAVAVALSASACGALAVVPPQPAPPPAPIVRTVAVVVTGTAGPLAGAGCALEDVAGFGPHQGVTNRDGYVAWNGVAASLTNTAIHCTAIGYLPLDLSEILKTSTNEDLPPVTMATRLLAPTAAQIADLQGDLMLWIPALAPHFVDGVDPVTGVREHADNGSTPWGIHAGWVWTLWTPLYPPDQRQQIYVAAKAEGYTHFALNVAQCVPSPGYHGLRPMSAEDCAANGDALNTVLREVRSAGLISVCAGVSSTQPLQAGVDASLCGSAMTDWDDWDQADCQIDAVARAFPSTTPIYFEQPPDHDSQPQPDACTPPGLLPAADGGAWIRAATRRHPNFTGMLIETNRAGLDADTTVIAAAYRWWRDIQVALFETDTYEKFWDNLGHDEAASYNDALRQRTPALRGFMSGGTTHAPPSNDRGGSGTFAGELDLHQATLVQLAGDFADWLVTTTIQSIAFDSAGLHIEFSKRDGPDRWPDVPFGNGGSLQYTIGLAEQIDGRWYASAPIQMWFDEPRSGGDITLQDIGDGTHRGQIRANWFYDGRGWGAMQGYQPKAGETIGLFVCAGDCREGDPSRSIVHERSNVVLFPLPASPGLVLTAVK